MLKALRFSELLSALDAQLIGADGEFDAVNTDSRSIKPGQLFIALTGPRFDGHNYLNEVAGKGAVAALVERHIADSTLSQLIVKDCRVALGQLAAMNRKAYRGPLAAVTGSSGKTTVKEMLASIMREANAGEASAVLATRGNLNNDLGAPLTLLELSPEHKAAVIELGASRVGEIAYTVSLAKPQVAMITNAGTAHVGEFGGPEKIVEAKGEIIASLSEHHIAVLNKDDAAFAIWSERAKPASVLSFAKVDSSADFHASDCSRDPRGCANFTLNCSEGMARIQLNLLGEHNISNALAAAAAAHALSVPLIDIKAGLEALQPVKGRAVAQLAPNGMRVIDDTYNANPASICAAIDILAGFSGRTVLVLGDMGELGEWAEQSHRAVGEYAKGKVDALYAVGPLMSFAVEEFATNGRHFADQASLIEALRLESGDTTVLIKGSRSAAMEKIVAALCGTSGEIH